MESRNDTNTFALTEQIRSEAAEACRLSDAERLGDDSIVAQRQRAVADFRQLCRELARQATVTGLPTISVVVALHETRRRGPVWTEDRRWISRPEYSIAWILTREVWYYNNESGSGSDGTTYYLLGDGMLFRPGHGVELSQDWRNDRRQGELAETIMWIAQGDGLYKDPSRWEVEFCSRILAGWHLLKDERRHAPGGYAHWSWST